MLFSFVHTFPGLLAKASHDLMRRRNVWFVVLMTGKYTFGDKANEPFWIFGGCPGKYFWQGTMQTETFPKGEIDFLPTYFFRKYLFFQSYVCFWWMFLVGDNILSGFDATKWTGSEFEAVKKVGAVKRCTNSAFMTIEAKSAFQLF